MPQDKLDLIDILGLRDDPTLPPEERRRRARERGRILGSESAMAQAQVQADALLAQGGNALVDAALNSPFELATSVGMQVAERYAPSGQEIYERTRRDPLSVRELSPAEEQRLDEYQAQKHATDVARSEAFWDYLMHVPRSSEEIGQILKWMADPNARPEDMPAGGFLPELALGISPIGIAQDIRDIYRDISQGEVGGWTAAAAIPAGGDIARGIRRARAASKATDVARLVHYGPQARELDVIDPKYMGRGQAGAERARQEAMGERFQPRSYFYREGDPVEPRFQNQPSATVELPESAIYDLTKDPEGLLPQARKQAAADGLFGDEAVLTYAENLATERGYRATYDGSKVQVFEPTRVVRAAEGLRPEMERAVEIFGTTDDIRKAGWILPDGRMLDFSAGRETRQLDHTNIWQAFDDIPGERSRMGGRPEFYRGDPDRGAMSVEQARDRFNAMGAIRVDVRRGGMGMTAVNAEARAPLTEAQRHVLTEAFPKTSLTGKDEIVLEFRDREGKQLSYVIERVPNRGTLRRLLEETEQQAGFVAQGIDPTGGDVRQAIEVAKRQFRGPMERDPNVVRSAIIADDGKVYSGRNHGLAAEEAREAGVGVELIDNEERSGWLIGDVYVSNREIQQAKRLGGLEGLTNPFMDSMVRALRKRYSPTREEFIGRPKIVREGTVFDAGSNFGPVWYRSADRAKPEPFMGGKYTIKRGESEGSPFYNVYDGDKLIASYDGETLAVEKAYRRQGIGEELVVDLRGRHPEIPPAPIRTETSQGIMERAYERLYGEETARPAEAVEAATEAAKPVQLEAAIRLSNGQVYSAGGPLHAPSIDQAVTLENVPYAAAARATRGFLHPETGEFMTAAETRAFREGTYEPERVIGAVMRVGGEDFVGLSHSDAIEAARHAGKSEAEINAALRTNREGWGFRTNRGRNVGRKEAADIETAERKRRAATVAPVKRGLNESIIEAHATGGSTFDPRTGKNMVGTEKWSVSPLKETETVYERPLVPEDVAEFRERNAKLLEDPDLFVGTWEDEGKHYIDIVTLVDDEEDAIRIGIGADQKSIAHLGRVARKEWDTAFQEVPQVSEADRALARADTWERFPVLSEMRRERFVSHLDPAQRKRFDKLGEKRQEQALRIYSLMPTPREGASLAMVGAAQRGWYEASGKTLYEIFGDDAPRFTAMLASFSPQMKVEDNLVAALEMWKRWINAGRPVDRTEIANLIPTGIALEKPPIYSAVEPNTFTALTAKAEDLLDLNILEEGGLLSGMKVDPFYANLMGATQRVTIDTHMTRLGPTEPRAVGVTKNIGMSAATRAVIDEMEKLTGTRLDPREVQEMQWSGLKAMMERLPNEGLGRAANKMSIEEILFGPNAETFAGPIEELRFASERTPSFASLFEKPEISKYLEAIQGAQMPTPRRPIGLQIDPSKIRLEDLRRIAQRMDMARWKQYLFQLAPFALMGGGGLLGQQLMGADPEQRPSLFQ